MVRRKVEALFPELREIKEKDLREKVIQLWILSAERGRWKDIENIPFTLLIPTQTSLIDHTRRVTRMAISIAKTREDLNYDYIVAGGLCHDAGKLLEYERVEGKVKKSRYGEFLRHPISGAMLAQEIGLPLEVIHIIAAHSTEGEKLKRTPEAIIIHHCDFIDFDIEKNSI